MTFSAAIAYAGAMYFLIAYAAWVAAAALLIGSWALGRKASARALRLGEAPEYGSELPAGYDDAPRWRRIALRLGGPLAAYLACSALFAVALTLIGERDATTTIDVLPGQAAEQAGLRSGDRLVAIDGAAVQTFDQVRERIVAASSGTLKLDVDRGGARFVLDAPLSGGRLGVTPRLVQRSLAATELLPVALWEPARVLIASAQGLLRSVSGAEPGTLTGPVAITREVAKTSTGGSQLHLVALLAAFAWPGVWLLELAFGRPRRQATLAEQPLASRRRRLLAFCIDAALLAVAVAAGVMLGVVRDAHDESLAVYAAGAALPLLFVQWVLISKVGQSLAKRWLELRILRADGQHAGFVHGVVLRSWVAMLLTQLPLVGMMFMVGNVLAIFRRDRRCLHDVIARTVVVRVPQGP
jgi:membrane-associated protease RseP (regulator of RpoE activity)